MVGAGAVGAQCRLFERCDRREAGLAMIRVLSEPKWLTKEEILLLDAAWREVLAEGADQPQPRSARASEDVSSARPERPVKREAARLRVALDRRLSRSTPDWGKALAEEHQHK